jgi:hypothetical protein
VITVLHPPLLSTRRPGTTSAAAPVTRGGGTIAGQPSPHALVLQTTTQRVQHVEEIKAELGWWIFTRENGGHKAVRGPGGFTTELSALVRNCSNLVDPVRDYPQEHVSPRCCAQLWTDPGHRSTPTMKTHGGGTNFFVCFRGGVCVRALVQQGRDGWELKGEQSKARARGYGAYTRGVAGGQSRDPRPLRGGRSLLAERGMRRGDNFIWWGISLRARLGASTRKEGSSTISSTSAPKKRGRSRHARKIRAAASVWEVEDAMMSWTHTSARRTFHVCAWPQSLITWPHT